jgi:hypothetical protein
MPDTIDVSQSSASGRPSLALDSVSLNLPKTPTSAKSKIKFQLEGSSIVIIFLLYF